MASSSLSELILDLVDSAMKQDNESNNMILIFFIAALLHDSDIYNNISNRIWKFVCYRIITS